MRSTDSDKVFRIKFECLDQEFGTSSFLYYGPYGKRSTAKAQLTRLLEEDALRTHNWNLKNQVPRRYINTYTLQEGVSWVDLT